MLKKCERCGNNFECNAENISECGCNNVQLNPEERKSISDKFSDCLCLNCLNDVKQKNAKQEA